MPRIKRRLTKKRDNMDEEYNRLAEIKSIIKSLDDEAKFIQSKILDSDFKRPFVDTEYGVLTLRIRENWKVVDKPKLIKEMGQKEYNSNSTISKTGIKNSIGTKGLAKMEGEGVLELAYTSTYYQLGKKK